MRGPLTKLILGYCLSFGMVVAAHAQQGALSVKVVTSSEGSLYANFTLVMGEHDMVLIDAPFTYADAHRLVAEILESGRKPSMLYVTHDHPDHFWGMQVILDAFPGVQVVSHPQVVADIWRSIPFKIKRWGPLLGSNGPSYPTAPKAWNQDYIELEGHRLNILGPMQGDHHHATAIYIPEINTLIAGDLAFHGVHVWLGEATEEARLQWVKNLDELMRLKPTTVVAGHKLPQLDNSPQSLAFTRDYILAFNREARTADNSAALISRMRQLYPDVQDVLNDFILPNSARVGVGEEQPWQE